jgi:hypothetical protein
MEIKQSPTYLHKLVMEILVTQELLELVLSSGVTLQVQISDIPTSEPKGVSP